MQPSDAVERMAPVATTSLTVTRPRLAHLLGMKSTRPTPARTALWIIGSTLGLTLCLLLTACGGSTPNRDPVGEVFPAVRGTGLDGTAHTLPGSLGEGPTVAIVGYVQNAQFDIDRWLLGLAQLRTPAAVFELPTVEGMIPGMIAGRIDEGMRSGIPQEDWAVVITIYDDAEAVTRLTGTERPRNARVLLLDGDGRIRWFHDRGYSAGVVQALDAEVRALRDQLVKPSEPAGAARPAR